MSMDALKQQLLQRKTQNDEKKWYKKHDEDQVKEQAALQRIQASKLKEQQKVLKKVNELDKNYKGISLQELSEQFQALPKKKVKTDKPDNYDGCSSSGEEEPGLEKAEVIKQLRVLCQPITFFGESNKKRYKRLLKCRENKEETSNSEAQTNFFNTVARMTIEDFKKYRNNGEEYTYDQTFIDRMSERNFDKYWGIEKQREKKDELLMEGIPYDERCEESLHWIHKILSHWEAAINAKYHTDQLKMTREGKNVISTYRQVIEYIRPLLKQLKSKTLPEEIFVTLYQVFYYASKKEYVLAHDKYLEVAIGNAPWPIGVTMVGIHERSGRSRIYTSQIAHILNDETQRKYLQSCKRLITLSQQIFPNTEPTKMVNFLGAAICTNLI